MTKIELPKDGMPRTSWIFYILTDKGKIQILNQVSTYEDYRKARQDFNKWIRYDGETIKKRFMVKMEITEVEH